MSLLLDTCVISELVAKRPNLQVLRWIEEQDSRSLHISVMTIGEIAKGVCKLPESKRKDTLTVWLNQTLPEQFSDRILLIDIATMQRWGELVGRLEQQAKSLPVADSLIASVALHHDFHLVTRNEKDFIGTGVSIINPWVLTQR
jgi:toxin FitB